jgi:hypothetical protein
LVEQLYKNENFKNQQAQSLYQVLESMGESTTENNTDQPSNPSILDQEKITSIMDGSFIK